MRKHWSDVAGLTQPEACMVLEELASNMDPDFCIVEVGVYKGKSLVAMGAVTPAQVVGVDPWDLPRPSKPKYSDPAVYAEARRNVEGYENITLIRAFSTAAAAHWEMGYPKIGLWYLDADHRKLPVLEDFAAWRPHMAPGCMVTFDDHHLDFPGVIEAVNCLWQKRWITRPVMATDRLAVSTLL